jgi:putative PIN family toxin of toxin-antitoxin system
MKAVLDTNVYVSGLISPTSPPDRILDDFRSRRFTACFSSPTLAEFDDVLSRPEVTRYFRRSSTWMAEFRGDLRRFALTVEVAVVAAVPEDPPDNLILGTAVAASADYIVSGDNHLLALGSYQGIPILTPRQFLFVLDQVS